MTTPRPKPRILLRIAKSATSVAAWSKKPRISVDYHKIPHILTYINNNPANDLLADERRRRIVERLRADRMVRVVGLAVELDVAEETIRRDLKLLDERGILTRTHGGAVPRWNTAPAMQVGDLPFEHRRKAMGAQKHAIAKEALKRIALSSTIALDGSTTAFELASLLTDPSLTIVTNSLLVATMLASRPGPSVISVGGSLDRDLMMFTGMIALDGLRHVQIDQFFCSCGGIDPVRGFSDPSDAGAQFKREIIKVAGRTIMLADSTKFASRAAVLYATPKVVSEIITDTDAPEEITTQLEASGLPCTRVATT